MTDDENLSIDLCPLSFSRAEGGHASGGKGMAIYEITQNGVVLHATIAGTKYPRDNELN